MNYHSESATIKPKAKAGRLSGQATEAGSGDVMESMKRLLSTVELSDLKQNVRAEVNNLNPEDSEGEYSIWAIFENTHKINDFVLANQSNIVKSYNNTTEHYNVSIKNQPHVTAMKERLTRIRNMPVNSEMERKRQEEEEESEFSLMASSVTESTFSTLNASFVVKAHDDDYEIRWVPGSDPRKLAILETRYAIGNRLGIAAQLNNSISYGINPNIAAALSDSKFFINRLNSMFNTNVESLTERTLFDVPFDFNFAPLFQGGGSLDDSEFKTQETAIDPSLASKFKDRWGLTVSLRLIQNNNPANTDCAKAVLVEFMVFPRIKISKAAMTYLTQEPDQDKIKLATVMTWATDWYENTYSIRDTKVTPYSSILSNFDFSKRKEEAIGVKPLDTRADPETGLFVNLDGRLVYAPATTDIDRKTVEAYEQILSELVEESAKINEPVNFDSSIEDRYLRNSPVVKKMVELKDKLKVFKTLPLISNWDLDISGSINPDDPTYLDEINLNGGAPPSNISFSENLQTKMDDGARFFLSRKVPNKSYVNSDDSIIFTSPGTMMKELDTPTLVSLVYAFLKGNNKVQNISYYLRRAADAIYGRPLKQGDLEFGLYKKPFRFMNQHTRILLSEDCSTFDLPGPNSPDASEAALLREILITNLARGVSRLDGGPDYEDFAVDYTSFWLFTLLWLSLPHYACDTSTVGEWDRQRWINQGKNLSDYEFQDSEYYMHPALNSLAKFGEVSQRYVVGKAYAMLCSDMLDAVKAKGNPLLNYDEDAKYPIFGGRNLLPDYKEICEAVMPYLATFGKIVSNASSYIEKAKQEQEAFKVDPNADVGEIPGASEFAVWLHQYKALKLLSKSPKVALLDIAPGGGKTITGLIDCAILLGQNKIRRPLIMAPLNLIKNWIEDLNHKITDTQFNCVPITNATVEKWGQETLKNLILNSPPNTIFYTDSGSSPFVSQFHKKIELNFLNTKKFIYANLEWMKQFDFDYILIDESHLLKNAKGASGGSIRSRTIAELTLSPAVKYLRLASGTIINKDLDDIIGQARLFNPAIFRTEADFLANYQDQETGNFSPDAAHRIRKRLAQYCAVSTAKRKEWAYALPMPRENNPIEWFVEMTPEFKEVYDHVCKDTLEEIKKDEKLARILLGDDAEAIDDLLEEGDEDEDESTANVYLSRLEQFLIAPENDPLNGYNGWDFAKLDTPKMPKLVEILNSHFSDPEGQKVIVFVRHKSSVNGIINRLPPSYLGMTVAYNGSDAELKANLNRFLYDDDIKILVGVEQSINTGENLQIASRIIRMEIPWTPGDLDQALSRIFRPNTEKANRKFIDSDWILVNDSFDVPKIGRLISRIISKVHFDEYGSSNRAYSLLPSLLGIPMNLKNFLSDDPDRAIRKVEDIRGGPNGEGDDYLSAYASLAEIQREELLQVRSEFIDEDNNLVKSFVEIVEGREIMKGSRRLTFTPNIPNQNTTNDLAGDGLTPFTSWVTKHKDFITDFENFPQVFVKTEFGYGMIVSGFRGARMTKSSNKLTVLLAHTEGLTANVEINSIYVASELTGAKMKEPRVRKYVGANNEKIKRENLRNYIGLNPREVNGMIYVNDYSNFKEEPKVYDFKEALIEDGMSEEDALIAVEDRQRGTRGPARISLSPEPEAKDELVDEDEEGLIPEETSGTKDNKLKANVALINGTTYLVVNGDDPDAAGLPGFTPVRPFIGVKIETKRELQTFLTRMEGFTKTVNGVKQNLVIQDRQQFEDLLKRFDRRGRLSQSGPKLPKDIEFLFRTHRKPKNELLLKLGYIVDEGELFLVFNIAAYPLIAKRLFSSKRFPGLKNSFQIYKNARVKAYRVPESAETDLARINKVVEIVNYGEIVDELKTYKK